MPGDPDDEMPGRQTVTTGRDAYVAGRGLNVFLLASFVGFDRGCSWV
jgi:hypothetical protein